MLVEHPSTPTQILLVHGTFARNAKWTQPGSTLRTELQTQLGEDVDIHCFSWSGANSHRSRMKAAQRLRKQLLETTGQHGPLGIVAHSHGGTILAYALQDPDFRARVQASVFLATPFLICKPRSISGLRRLAAVICAAILLALSAHFLENMIEGALLMTALSNASSRSEASSPITAVVLSLILFLSFLIGLSFVAAKVASIWGKKRQCTLVTAIQTIIPAGTSLLVVRSEQDEAAFYLSSWRNIETVFYYCFNSWWIPIILGIFGFVATVVPQISEYLETTYKLLQHPWGEAELLKQIYIYGRGIEVLAMVCYGLPLAIFAFRFIVKVVGWGFSWFTYMSPAVIGLLSPLGSFLVDIRISPEPIASQPIETKLCSFSSGLKRLFPSAWRHSQIHDDPEVCREITAWLGSHLAKQRASSA